jgi:hypothetical protein
MLTSFSRGGKSAGEVCQGISRKSAGLSGRADCSETPKLAKNHPAAWNRRGEADPATGWCGRGDGGFDGVPD